MTRDTIPVQWFLDAAQVFHWATKRHFQLWFTGQVKTRHSRTERVLYRLSKRRKLRSVRYGKSLVYALPKKSKNLDEFAGLGKIAHGLACTECLVRVYRSRLDGEVIPERFFYGCGSVPEWGIRYPNKTLLLLEFCTKSNFLYSGVMRGKLSAYKQSLEKIEEKFQAAAIVLFVIDAPRATVARYVGRLKRDVGSVADAPYEGDRFPLNPFFFVDYESFKKIPIGQQLYAPIYFWTDGKEYPLSKNDKQF